MRIERTGGKIYANGIEISEYELDILAPEHWTWNWSEEIEDE